MRFDDYAAAAGLDLPPHVPVDDERPSRGDAGLELAFDREGILTRLA